MCEFVNHRKLLRGGWIIIMAGIECMEWHQTHGNHVLNTIPFMLVPAFYMSPPSPIQVPPAVSDVNNKGIV
jgi:hypothetical protein